MIERMVRALRGRRWFFSGDPRKRMLAGVAAMLAAAMALAGCAGSIELEPEPSYAVPTTEEPTEPVAPAIPLTPASDLVRIETQNPADDALAVSQELFESAHVAVVAPHDNTAAVWLASSVAAQAGIPVLLSGRFEGSLNAELIRLGVHGIITVGPVDLTEIDVTSLSIAPVTSEEDLAEYGLAVTTPWVEFTPGGKAVQQLQQRPDGGYFGPPPEAVTNPGIEPAGELEQMSATKRLTNVVMLVTRQASVAALANAQAAGAELVEYRDDIATDTELIADLHSRQPESVLTLGALPGGDDVPWLLTAAIRGELLPTGTQELFNPTIRYIGAVADTAALEDPVTFWDETLARYLPEPPQEEETEPQGSDGAVAPLVVIPFGGESASIARVRPMVNYVQEHSGLVLVDITAPDEEQILDLLEQATPLLSLPHVGVTLDATAATVTDEQGRTSPGVSALMIENITTRLSGLTRERGLPQKLFMLQLFQPEFLHGSAEPVSEDRAVEIVLTMNGYGPQIEKTIAWETLHTAFPQTEHWGWLVYPDREPDWLKAGESLGKQPRLDVIIYQ